MRRMSPARFVHVHSLRLAGGQEALVARVQTTGGKTGFGFTLRLDATEARHMAEWAAGVRAEPPRIHCVLDHPWERAFLSKSEIQWNIEPAFAKIRWLP